MVSKSVLVGNLSPYLGKKKVILYNQNTNDIIDELIKSHKINAKEYDKIYKYFDDTNVLNIAKNLFNFCKKNIKYNIESGNRQSLRTPAAILINGSGDCKQYSQFIGGVLDAINRNSKRIDWFYRFAAYNEKKEIQHVFIVIKINNIEYWIDPVLNYFNEKKQFNNKIDKKMSLYQISGMENDEIGKLKLKFPKIKIAKGIDKAFKDVKKVVLKVGLAPSRNAFLAIVSFNSFNLGKKIARGILKDRRKVELFWKNLGGDFNALLRAVNNRQSQYKVSGNMIGFDPASGTAAAAAAPIIAAALKVLKEMGIDTEDIAGSVSKLAQKEAVKLIENNGKQLIQNGLKSVLKTSNEGNPQVEVTNATPEEIQQSQNNVSTGEPTKKNNTILYVGAAAAALYFITKK
jgi:uncharacterized OsmC-like protein